MNTKRILLAFDGSTQSLNAAELCWSLASQYPIRLTAQHVVNTVGLWQLLNFELPGLTGSGPFIAAHEAMGRELRSIGETLVTIYETKAKGYGLADQCVMDEGDAISEVMRRATVHDLVVIGHHPFKQTGRNGQDLPRYLTHFSMAEALARVLDKPLLIVQGTYRPWTGIKLILHGTQGVNRSFNEAAAMAAFFNLPLEVDTYFVGDPEDNELPEIKTLIDEALKTYPQLQITARTARLWPSDANEHLASVGCGPDVLVMVPTFSGEKERASAFGTTLDLFVRYNCAQSLLLFPADQVEANKQLETAAGTTGKSKAK